MRSFLVALAGLAGLTQAAAVNKGCCNPKTNKCFKDISDPRVNGVQDCSLLLVVTVTPAATTATNTVAIVPTQYTTVVNTQLHTAIETTLAWIETVFYTVSTTVTAVTQTNVIIETQTVAAFTQTVWQTVTVSSAAALVARHRNTGTRTDPSPAYPPYADKCKSWKDYATACSCLGVVPTTVTLATPTETVVVEQTSTLVNSTFITVTNTVTQTISVTATASLAKTTTIVATATELLTSTQTVPITITTTTTTTLTPPQCTNPTPDIAFRARITVSDTTLLMIASYSSNDRAFPVFVPPPANPDAATSNRLVWALDAEGRLYTAYKLVDAGGNPMPRLYAYAITAKALYRAVNFGTEEMVDADGGWIM